MKVKEIEALESYFKTENEHWNSYAFEMLCEVLKHGNFENSETPLQLFNQSVNIFTEQSETPLKAIQEVEVKTKELNTAQKLFVYEWIFKYLKRTEYEEIDLTEIMDLLKSQIERLKNVNQIENQKPITGSIRDNLKELMQKEIERLPETLKELEAVQRLNILCKLIPYVLPKVESVSHTQGEPESEADNGYFKW